MGSGRDPICLVLKNVNPRQSLNSPQYGADTRPENENQRRAENENETGAENDKERG